MGLSCQALEIRPGAGAAVHCSQRPEHTKTQPGSIPCCWNAQSQHSNHIWLRLRPRSEGLTQLPASPSRFFWRRSRCGSGEAEGGWLGPGLSSPAAAPGNQGCKLGSDVGNLPL